MSFYNSRKKDKYLIYYKCVRDELMNCDFYAIDFETANESLDSACSIGVVGVKNEKIVIEEHYYFHPHQNFSEANIMIHHITPDMVWGLDDFEKLWPKIYDYFNGTTIVAHNAQFDLNVLKALVDRYKLKKPNIKFVCTYKMSTMLWDKYDGFLNHRLDTLARYLDIEFKHHDALDDARVCALAASRIMRIEQASTLIEASKKISLAPGVYNKERFYTSYKQEINMNPKNEILLDKVFYISGNSVFKKNLVREIKECGGIVEKTFRENCDYFVVLDGYDKQKLSLAKKEKYISIVTETEVLELIYDN